MNLGTKYPIEESIQKLPGQKLHKWAGHYKSPHRGIGQDKIQRALEVARKKIPMRQKLPGQNAPYDRGKQE